MDAEKGQKKVENIRYGQNMSESGMGGKMTDVEGEAHQGVCDPVIAWPNIKLMWCRWS
jgi:hypothetical protein